jgi:hypothetical protein
MQSPIITPTRRRINRKRHTKAKRTLAFVAGVLAGILILIACI